MIVESVFPKCYKDVKFWVDAISFTIKYKKLENILFNIIPPFQCASKSFWVTIFYTIYRSMKNNIIFWFDSLHPSQQFSS